MDFKKKMEDIHKKIGTKLVDTPCPKCQVKLIDGICPNCVAEVTATVDPNNKFKNYLFNPLEKVVCILGNDYLQNYLSGGAVSKSFSVVSDKRIYFRGKVFEIVGDRLRKKKVSSAVNIRDVTGVSVTYIAPIHYFIFGSIALLIGLILATTSVWIFLAGLAISAVNFLLYFFKRVTLLKIQYAGGAIGFDVKWFPEAESLAYQKSLFLVKDKIFKDAE
jgi:hypothetical protein